VRVSGLALDGIFVADLAEGRRLVEDEPLVSGEDWKRGLKRIAPGLYDDGEGRLHLDDAELLEANGYAATAENLAVLYQALDDYCAGKGLTVRKVEPAR
jgi:hypothetical protein